MAMNDIRKDGMASGLAGSAKEGPAAPPRHGRGGSRRDDRWGRTLFEQAHKAITEGKLYLDPAFSRDTYIRLCLVNKNLVAQLVRRYAGTNLNGYINGLRLEHSKRLLSERPDLPIKAVALDSGFSSLRSFYRLFVARYGLTPTKYKKSL